MTIDTSKLHFTHYWAARQVLLDILDEVESRLAALEEAGGEWDGGLNERLEVIEDALTQTLTVSIAASADDGHEVISTTVMSINATTMALNDTNTNGVRFLVPDLPQGSTIASAKITFIANANTDTGATVTIAGFDEDATATLTTDNANISSRPLTTTTVSWVIADGSWAADSEQDTPDLTDIVQEIVNREGFDGVLGFRLTKVVGSGSNRSVRTIDNGTDDEAVLTVGYLGAPALPSNVVTWG